MRAYWWTGEKVLGDQRNWGDQLNPFILSKMQQDHQWSDPEHAELAVCGSILEHLPYNWAGTICGAGKLYERSRIHLADARVFALRGKLTLAGVSGLHPNAKHSLVLGDPGLLTPRWVKQPVAKHNLGVLPHWSDKELHQRFPYGKYIDPFQSPEAVIKEINQCKALITSSLHGVIVADAYGILRQAELFPNASTEGGDFKYRDYTSVYGEDPHFGHMHRVPHHLVEKIQNDLYQALQIATGIDLPNDLMARRDPQISILVPFRDDGEHRSRAWHWLRRYYRARGLNAEIVQGHDDGSPFSKARAVNHAASLSRGRVFAILDADAYLPPQVLTTAAASIERSITRDHRMWYMPYNELYRLSQLRTQELLATDPAGPILTGRPVADQVEATGGYDLPSSPYMDPFLGHQYGAMAMILPREAFMKVQGMDPRFKGWGGEDVSFLRALDTAYGHHEVMSGQVLHFWHSKIGSNHLNRQWVGQPWSLANDRLAQRYATAIAEPDYMDQLAAEHPLGW